MVSRMRSIPGAAAGDCQHRVVRAPSGQTGMLIATRTSAPVWAEWRKGNAVKTYRCAIIGLTNIASGPVSPSLTGGRHLLPYSHASALAMIPNTRVVAVCELVPALAQAFVDRWSGTWEDIRVYSDYREMLAREEIDILS